MAVAACGTTGSKSTSDLGSIPADAVRVELYAEPLESALSSLELAYAIESTAPEVHALEPASPGNGTYAVEVRTARPTHDYTPRVVPSFPGVRVPLEAGHILWYR